MTISEKQITALALVIAPALLFSGCGTFGKVDQGKVIAYDRQNRTVTVIRDSNSNPAGKPSYDALPPLTIRVPVDPNEMGPAPEAGKLLHLDSKTRRLVFFDAAAQQLRTVEYQLSWERRNVARSSPPVVDRKDRTITVYDAAERALITFSASDELLAMPEDTWKAGDEIRYYYKDSTQALRLMNVTRTDLTKSGG